MTLEEDIKRNDERAKRTGNALLDPRTIDRMRLLFYEDLLYLRKSVEEGFDPSKSVRVQVDGKTDDGKLRLRMSSADPEHGYELMKALQENPRVCVFNTSIKEFEIVNKDKLKKESETNAV